MNYEVPTNYNACVKLWQDMNIIDLRCLTGDDRDIFLDQMAVRHLIDWGVLEEVTG